MNPICLHNLQLRANRLSLEHVQELDQAEVERVKVCRDRSQNPRASPSIAYRRALPVLPILRTDGVWMPGDRGHPLGPNRRLLLLSQ